MHRFTVGRIAEAVGGVLRQGDGQLGFDRVTTDSRKVAAGSLFVPLRGASFDGHDFLEQAVAAGAGGLLVDRATGWLPEDIPVVVVEDTLGALQDLAAYNREMCNIPVVGITGSSGKTTTKDLLAGILSTRWRTVKTPENYNNEIGLPLTLLELDEQSEIGVAEMGMRGLGQIQLLCRIAKPTVAMITNIGEAHMELLGSVDNIARAKGEILDQIPESGFALLHGASAYIRREAKRCRGRVIYFGFGEDCEARAVDLSLTPRGSTFTVVYGGCREEYSLALPGEHNVLNALAASVVCRELGFSPQEIARGLGQVAISAKRLDIQEVNGISIIDDTYNANPASVKGALQVLQQVAQDRRTIAVLGDMQELGDRTREGHLEVGGEAARLGINLLVAVGDKARHIAQGAGESGMADARISHCANNEEASALLKDMLRPGDVVLVKGSRSMGMEAIVAALLQFKCL